VGCRGNEATLDDCPHNGIGIHDCFHFDDAGVVCSQQGKHAVPYVIKCCTCCKFTLNNFPTQNVLQEKCDWLMVYLMVMVVWNCATEECGVQCVMTFGMMMMQLWSAGNLDTVQRVGSIIVYGYIFTVN